MAVSIDSAVAESASHLEQIEIDLLLEGLYQLYGDDFRGYERPRLKRKLLTFMQAHGLASISALQAQVMHERAMGEALLRSLLERPGGLFDAPGNFKLLRETAGPLLRSYVVPKVWLAECASVEDVFSLAILLEEEGLCDKTLLYATSPNEAILSEARKGVCAADKLPEYAENYRLSGGKAELTDYCIESAEGMAFRPQLQRNVIWSQFSLASDNSFNEFQLIVCRAQLTDFAAPLQRRALTLFSQSLSPFGILNTEHAPGLEAAPFSIKFQGIAAAPGLYRYTGW
jgi:chemotaxis protein methyltransferase CheR